MAEITVGLEFGYEFEGTLKAAKTSAAIGSKEGELAPYDMLLGALGSCFYATFAGVAKKMRLEYQGVSIEIHGVKREEIPPTLTTVDMVLTIHGAQDEKGFDRAAELAGKYCSIHETISKVAQIRTELRFS